MYPFSGLIETGHPWALAEAGSYKSRASLGNCLGVRTRWMRELLISGYWIFLKIVFAVADKRSK